MINRAHQKALVACAAALTATLVGASLAQAAEVTTPDVEISQNVFATDSQGYQLGSMPTLTPGDLVTLTVPGFDADVPIQVKLGAHELGAPAPHAGPSGVLVLDYRVPEALSPGPYVLTFVAAGSSDGTSADVVDGGNAEVTVPNVGVFAFAVT